MPAHRTIKILGNSGLNLLVDAPAQGLAYVEVLA
jgi:hypothetical protein